MSKVHRRDAAGGGPAKTNGHGKPAPPVKTYVEGQPFPGRIGRTWDVSEPAFPVPPSPPKGAPNVLYVILDDVGFGWSSTFGGLIETPNITKLADNGLRVRQLPHDGALLADASVPADGPQPPLGRDGEHHRARDRLSGLQRPPAQGQGRDRIDPPRVRLRLVRARQVAQHRVGRDRPERPLRPLAERLASSASIGSTDSSVATRTSGIRSSTSIASRSISRACPRRATTSPKTSPSER